MKKSKKIIFALALVLALLVGSFIVLKSCGSKNVDKSGFDQKTSKTTQSSATDEKNTKSSSKKSDKNSSKIEQGVIKSPFQNSKNDASSAKTSGVSEKHVTESSGPTVAQDSPIESKLSQSESEAITQPQGGFGGWEATSGTLELDKDTPVYAEPNKESGVVYMHSKSAIEWRRYFNENGEWWYMFLEKGGDEATQFYIAYSDVNH